MRIVQRLIFYVYTLLFTLLSFGAVLLCLRLVPADFSWTSVAAFEGNFKIGLAGIILFLGGMWVLLAGIFKRKSKKSVAYYTLLGNVNISLDAIESFIEKVAKSTDGVRDAKVDALLDAQTGTGITAAVKIAVSQEANISEVSVEMQNRIQECVKNTVGVQLDEIKIVVETISNDFKVKSRVQ